MADMTPGTFGIEDLDYRLPTELIAQHPLPERDVSRLLVVDRRAGTFRDATFRTLPELLTTGDVLVVNDTRVVPAKFSARRSTGGRVSGLFLREAGDRRWEVLLTRTGRLRCGERLRLESRWGDDALELMSHQGGGRWTARLCSDESTSAVLERAGRTPLPPYIRREDEDLSVDAEDRERYQTVFAERCGAVAAPTASLHFTEEVLGRLEAAGVSRASLTLHVGPGTFAPITGGSLNDHPMHEEWYEIAGDSAAAIEGCRSRGGRVVAAGTTTVRALETCAREGRLRPASGWTDLFIKPPFDFRMVDVLLTNFHLPRSTLLALVMAFAGVELTRAAYAHATKREYRFYSYGDAMLIV
jgi:S-adenosylmethionine:tRNA ribosyltransferase-isomerase